MWGVSCVLPIYSTARIELGLHADVGFASSVETVSGKVYDVVWQGNTEIRYGFNDYFQLNGRLGAGVVNDLHVPFFASAAFGFQLAYPFKVLTPAIRAELVPFPFDAGFPVAFSPSFLLGIGRTERVTLGVRWLLIPGGYPYNDVFATVHPFDRLAVFVGAPLLMEGFRGGPFTLGVGYKIK